MQAAAWKRERGNEKFELSVNLSVRQLHEPDLAARVSGALSRSGLDSTALVLEITESVMMEDADLARTRMEQLKALGVRLAVDDFGTGYSSLGYLQTFPIDVLKIDKSFVDGVAVGEDERAMLQAILALAKALRLTTVAEGIEELDQHRAMHELGCELGQGYLFARPMAPEALGELLADPNRTRLGLLADSAG